MQKLSISIDMGAKYNGVFIAKISENRIIDKKAECVVIDKNSLNFSKADRRANRHKVRNIKRRKLAKRVLWEILNKNSFTKEQQELIQGLLNNRGYNYISTSVEFDRLEDESAEFLNAKFEELKDLQTQDDFIKFLSNDRFDDENELLSFLKNYIEKFDKESKKKKSEFDREFKDYSSIIKKDLRILRDFFSDIENEIKTGSKPRKKYFEDIKKEIDSYDFIEDKEKFFNIIGNISNLQLRVLRKYFNNKFDNVLDDKKLYKKLNEYFKRFHDKEFKQKVFDVFNKSNSAKEFLETCNPLLTIPPYEDMNNKDTYKCNSMLIKDIVVTQGLKDSIDAILKERAFEFLDNDNLSYSQRLQRVLDVNSKLIDSTIHPRNVFKHQKDSSNIKWYQDVLKDNFNEFSEFAKKFYQQEDKIIKGLYDESFIFKKCNCNTPYKNNIKHTLLKPIYSYEFDEKEADELLKNIEENRKLKKFIELISKSAKEYQNSFYNVIEACFSNEKCSEDSNIKKIVRNLDENLQFLKEILKDKKSYLSKIEKVDKDNLKRVINIFKQTYEILFDNLKGFSKTCKNCSIENSIRSSEENPIAKRLLSDVAKPIDGMLDMMLDRIAWEIVKSIDEDMVREIGKLEIILEQNRFDFEENLKDIKKASNKNIKQKKREYKDPLSVNICPYTGKNIDKGEWDHVLPQSKQRYNSKANLIYCSSEGNRFVKKDKEFTLEDIHPLHLEEVFGKFLDNKNNKKQNQKSNQAVIDIEKIKEFIKKELATIDKDRFTNFNNLNLKQQIALRYALFMKGTDSFKKAVGIIKLDKTKTISNGTQKRLARLIYEKFLNRFKRVEADCIIVDNREISATRREFAVNKETGEVNSLFKEDIQDTHSHCIDAMVAFYLANTNHNFLDEVYLDTSKTINVKKAKTFINADDIKSFKLFQDTIYSEHYRHFTKDEKIVDLLIEHNLLYINKNSKKIYIKDKVDIETIAKIDTNRLSNLLFEAFNKKDKELLKSLKPLDKKRFITIRKDIASIFYNKGKLLKFEDIKKQIPPYQEKTYSAVFELLKDMDEFDFEKYQQKMTKFFKLQKRKRGKKRHIFSLPAIGQNAQYRVRRQEQFDILGSENIATRTYLSNNKLIKAPFFSKNVIPLKIKDLLEMVDLDENAKHIYEVSVVFDKLENIDEIKELKKYLEKLKYYLTEKSRLTIEVKFIKDRFADIDFSKIKQFDGAKDEEFKKFLQNYIQNKDLILYKYIGSIRDGLKGKATLLDSNKETITLQYKAETSKNKENLILKSI